MILSISHFVWFDKSHKVGLVAVGERSSPFFLSKMESASLSQISGPQIGTLHFLDMERIMVQWTTPQKTQLGQNNNNTMKHGKLSSPFLVELENGEDQGPMK